MFECEAQVSGTFELSFAPFINQGNNMLLLILSTFLFSIFE